MMQRIGTKNMMNLFKATRKVVTPSLMNCRFMSEANNNLTIKNNMEQLTGIRLQELQAEAAGKVSKSAFILNFFDNFFVGCFQ